MYTKEYIIRRGQKIHLSASNYKRNLERTSSYPQSSRPIGRVLWEELLEGFIVHITLVCLLHFFLLKDSACVCRTNENCKSLILQDKCNIDIFLSPD